MAVDDTVSNVLCHFANDADISRCNEMQRLSCWPLVTDVPFDNLPNHAGLPTSDGVTFTSIALVHVASQVAKTQTQITHKALR
jgi:hypothetical protein